MKSFEKRDHAVSNNTFSKVILTTEEKEAKIDGYANITLIFGKHKGLTLGEIHTKDPKYLLWLKTTSKVDDKTSPTRRAIYKYLQERV